MKYFGIIDDSSYKGYSNTVKSLLENVKDKEIIDISEMGNSAAIKKIISIQKDLNEYVGMVSAADMGFRFFEKFSKFVEKGKNNNNFEYSIATDRFFKSDLRNISAINIYAPEEVIDQYVSDYDKNNKIAFPRAYIADLVASPSKKDMLARAKDFVKNNDGIARIILNTLSCDAKALFIGGRVALSDGSFKENTPEIFAKTGHDFVKDGKDGVVVFHGLRSFTKGDKSNDFAPVEAFYEAVKDGLVEDQTIVMLTKELAEDGKRKSIARIFQKENRTIYVNDFFLKDSVFPAAEYYFLLNEVVKRGLDLTATVEQMNFISEALELGVDRNKFKPYMWELSVPSNHAVYKKLAEGKNMKTQKQLFDAVIKIEEWREKYLFGSYDAENQKQALKDWVKIEKELGKGQR